MNRSMRISGVTSSGVVAGTTEGLIVSARARFASLQVARDSGSSDWVVNLETSLDGENWYVAIAHDSAGGDTSGAIKWAAESSYAWWRVNVATAGAGNSLSISYAVSG